MSVDAQHWESVYSSKGDLEVSWYEEVPELSLELIGNLTGPEGTVVDIGGGASRLVDELLRRGHNHVTVLDLSAAALERARERVGDAAVNWIAGDVTSWKPDRPFDVWHDRAAFHFLVDASDREKYVQVLKRATHIGSGVIIGTFATDGPEKCSGLPVVRYDADSQSATLGPDFELERSIRHEHVTPWGSVQRFHFGVLRRIH